MDSHKTFLKVEAVDIGKFDMPSRSHVSAIGHTLYYLPNASNDVLSALNAKGIHTEIYSDDQRPNVLTNTAACLPIGEDRYSVYMMADDLVKLGATPSQAHGIQLTAKHSVPLSYTVDLAA